MEFLKKIDIKTWFIIILGIALIISFLFGQRSHIDTHQDELKALHEAEAALVKSNDSLKVANSKLDIKISDISNKLDANIKALADTQSELEILKKRKNETSTNVNRLSAHSVSNDFTNYLQSRTKGTSTR